MLIAHPLALTRTDHINPNLRCGELEDLAAAAHYSYAAASLQLQNYGSQHDPTTDATHGSLHPQVKRAAVLLEQVSWMDINC